MNFAQHLATLYAARPESSVHPHDPIEKAELYGAVDGTAAEVEVLNFINALVCLYKPRTLLETGTGSGFGTIAIAAAIEFNGLGHLETVDVDATALSRAQMNLGATSERLLPLVSFNAGESLSFIDGWKGERFDFVFFDSLIAFRHKELDALLCRGLLAPGAVCVFHDTSRLRHRYFDDFNPEMIASLDARSLGRQWLECPFSRGLRVLRLD